MEIALCVIKASHFRAASNELVDIKLTIATPRWMSAKVNGMICEAKVRDERATNVAFC